MLVESKTSVASATTRCQNARTKARSGAKSLHCLQTSAWSKTTYRGLCTGITLISPYARHDSQSFIKVKPLKILSLFENETIAGFAIYMISPQSFMTMKEPVNLTLVIQWCLKKSCSLIGLKMSKL